MFSTVQNNYKTDLAGLKKSGWQKLVEMANADAAFLKRVEVDSIAIARPLQTRWTNVCLFGLRPHVLSS